MGQILPLPLLQALLAKFLVEGFHMYERKQTTPLDCRDKEEPFHRHWYSLVTPAPTPMDLHNNGSTSPRLFLSYPAPQSHVPRGRRVSSTKLDSIEYMKCGCPKTSLLYPLLYRGTTFVLVRTKIWGKDVTHLLHTVAFDFISPEEGKRSSGSRQGSELDIGAHSSKPPSLAQQTQAHRARATRTKNGCIDNALKLLLEPRLSSPPPSLVFSPSRNFKALSPQLFL